MKKIILLCIFLTTSWCSFAQLGGELGYGFCKMIPTNRIYPEIKDNSSLVYMAAVWQTTGKVFRWAEHYNFPLIKLNLSYQYLGNDEILGNAFGILPSMSFYLKEGKNKGLKLDVGSGIAFLDQPYHLVNNPENNVYGSKFNFFFALGIAYEWTLKKDLALSLFAMIPHYSGSNIHQPNLGVNAFTIGTTIRYLRRQTVNVVDEEPLELTGLNKRVKPFFRVSYGLTSTGLNGPKYPAYVVGLGACKLLNRYSRINSGFEYIFNFAKYNFIKHTYAYPGEEFKYASRFSWYLGYELLFGHVGFLGEVGLYLNNHYGRQSIFTTKLGFNFYPYNTLSHSNFMPFFGAYVRAYGGEADFFEITAGFVF